MPATRRSPRPAEIAPEQRRDEIVAILAAGLVRLLGAGGHATALLADAAAAAEAPTSISGGVSARMPVAENPNSASAVPRMPTGALATVAAEKLSDSGETGLELSRETRLSVVAG